MKKFLALILTITTLSAVASEVTTQEYSQLFKHYEACFILYNLDDYKVVSEYNPNNRCQQRIAPDSTFKVALSLMAFNQSIIGPNTIFKWDGRKRELPTWNQDQTPYSWLKYSTVWVSQRITPQLGYVRIKHYLAGFDYGNQDFSGDPGKHNGLTEAWLSSSLKISAVEQLNFLNAMLSNELPVSNEAVNNTRKNLYLGKLDKGLDYYGKTGSGRHKEHKREVSSKELRDAWFIGFIDNGAQHYTFVSNLSDKVTPATHNKPLGSPTLMPITIKLLNNFFTK